MKSPLPPAVAGFVLTGLRRRPTFRSRSLTTHLSQHTTPAAILGPATKWAGARRALGGSTLLMPTPGSKVDNVRIQLRGQGVMPERSGGVAPVWRVGCVSSRRDR